MSIAVTAACLALLAGCPFSSKYPLSDPSASAPDNALLGSWTFLDPESKERVYLTIEAFDEHAMLGVTRDASEPPGRLETYRLVATTLGGQSFLSAQELGARASQEWFLVHYETGAGGLTLRFVDDAVLDAALVDSSDTLRRMMSERLSDPRLYGGDSGEPMESRWERSSE
jgi:hypothetical protein